MPWCVLPLLPAMAATVYVPVGLAVVLVSSAFWVPRDATTLPTEATASVATVPNYDLSASPRGGANQGAGLRLGDNSRRRPTRRS